MTKSHQTGKPKPDVDKNTAKGEGEGGFAPHPETPSSPPASLDPQSHDQPADAGDAEEPADDKHPIPAQRPSISGGSGHEHAKGGLPETQPTTKKQ